MAERSTAEARLERILYLLPAASGEDGRPLGELAAELGVTPRQVAEDVTEVIGREYYHPAGSVPALSVGLEEDRVWVWAGGEFERPVRLAPREALALGLGLRALAAEASPGRRSELLELAARLEPELATSPASELEPAFALEPGAGAEDGLGAFLRESAAERRPVAISYLKPGERAPEDRVIHPYVLVAAEGVWYVLGWCTSRNGVRAFRLDRILAARASAGSFSVPSDFEASAYVDGGRVYRAEEDVEVLVRYSARVARWVAEQGTALALDDGGVIVRYRVADAGWVVREVLRYGGEAEVVEPEWVRGLVADAARKLAASDG